MIKLNLRSHIQGATPEELFAALSDREGLKVLMPRLSKVEYLDRTETSETIVMHISIGSSFGTIPCEGTLSWQEPQQVTFTVRKPLPVDMQWTLTPAVNGTEMHVAMTLNLKPLLGSMTSFVPKNFVREMMEKEMTYAIKQVAQRVKEKRLVERAAAA